MAAANNIFQGRRLNFRPKSGNNGQKSVVCLPYINAVTDRTGKLL